jgi:hypothetical protein
MVDTSNRVPTKRPEHFPTDTTSKPVTAPKTKTDRIADDAARKASETEKEYDENHDIFSK